MELRPIHTLPNLYGAEVKPNYFARQIYGRRGELADILSFPDLDLVHSQARIDNANQTNCLGVIPMPLLKPKPNFGLREGGLRTGSLSDLTAQPNEGVS
jgi:hypothetical protein